MALLTCLVISIIQVFPLILVVAWQPLFLKKHNTCIKMNHLKKYDIMLCFKKIPFDR